MSFRQWDGLKTLVSTAWFFTFLALFALTPLPNHHVTRPYIATLLPQVFVETPFSTIYLPQRAGLLMVMLAIAAGAWGVGSLILRVFSLADCERFAERLVFCMAVGLSATSLLTLFSGLAGWLSRGWLGGVLAVSFALEATLRLRSGDVPFNFWTKRQRCTRKMHVGQPNDHESGNDGIASRDNLWMGLLVVPFLVLILLGSCLPSTDFDVNAYHFEGPKEYFLAGRVGFLPHNVYTSFPFFTEMLTLLAMVLCGDWYWGAVAGQALLSLFAPLTGLALYSMGRRWFSSFTSFPDRRWGSSAGIAAAVVYLTAPWTFRISTIAYVEGALSFYLLTAFFASARGFDVVEAVRPAGRWWLLSGMLAGSAMACKYPGLVSVVIPLGIGAVWCGMRGRRDDASTAARTDADRRLSMTSTAKYVAAYSLGVLLVIGPWLAKNIVETGNPVYPLAWRIFGGRDRDAELDAKFRRGHAPQPRTLQHFLEGVADVTVRNDWLSPLLFGLAPLSLWGLTRTRVNPAERALDVTGEGDAGRVSASLESSPSAAMHRGLLISLWIYLGWLFLTWWGLTHRIDRFWVPQIPIVALLAGAGWQSFCTSASATRTGRIYRLLVGTAALGAVLFNLGLVLSGLSGNNAFFDDLNVVRKSAAQRLTSPGVDYLNSHLPHEVKVLCVGEAQVFNAEFPLVYETVFNRSTFEQWFADPDDASENRRLRPTAELKARLKQEGITHIFVNWGEILRYRTTYGYTPFVTPGRFQELQRLGVLGSRLPIPSNLVLRRIDASLLDELKSWAPELLRAQNTSPAFITFEVYPVADAVSIRADR